MKKKTYNITMHLTPELKAFVGISSRDTWRYEGHWRGSALETEAAMIGWHNISHILVEDNLTKKQALQMRRELVESAGAISLNRAFEKEHKPLKKAYMKERQIALMAGMANGVKLSLTFDNRYLSKTGYPVVVRVYKDREWAYVPTGFSMTVDEFKNCNGTTMTVLEDKYKAVKDWCVKAVDNGVFSIKGARECLKEKKKTETLEGLMTMKMETLSNKTSMNSYYASMKKLKEVFGEDIELKDVNADIIRKFVSSLKLQGRSDATINIYLSAIKASINYGIYKGLFDSTHYPFKKNAWECDKITLPKSPKRQDRYITKDEMKRIWIKFNETGNKWIGLFLFSYLTGGMNLADMIGMKFNREWIDKRVIRWTRKKTAHKKNDSIAVPVSSWVDKLLARMGIEEKEGALVFDFLEQDYFKAKIKGSTYINMNMKRNGFNCSMTYARHSFATIATRMGMPAVMVENSMGHSLGGVQSHYIAGFDVDDMRQWFERLL